MKMSVGNNYEREILSINQYLRFIKGRNQKPLKILLKTIAADHVLKFKIELTVYLSLFITYV
jgi:hypothetical protein